MHRLLWWWELFKNNYFLAKYYCLLYQFSILLLDSDFSTLWFFSWIKSFFILVTSAFLGSWISFEVSIYFAIPSQILLISPSDSNVSNSTCSWHLLLSFKIIWIVQKENQRVRKCYFVGVKKKMVMFLTFLAFRRTSRCEAQSDMSLWAFFRTTFCCSASIALFSLSFSIQHSLKMLPEDQKYLLSLGAFLKEYLFVSPECIFRQTNCSSFNRHDFWSSS